MLINIVELGRTKKLCNLLVIVLNILFTETNLLALFRPQRVVT